jgi:hypothetical protein
MLVEELQPFIIAAPPGYERPANFYLTINKTTTNQWSAGYQDYTTLRVLLGINDCDDLGEVAIRLNARLNRYHHANAAKTHTLHNAPKGDTVGSTSIKEDHHMDDTTGNAQKLSHGQKLVGVRFNPSKDSKVDELKQHAADMIDILENLNASESRDPDTDLLQQTALSAIVAAQMAAVKRATWNIAQQQATSA